MPCRPTPYDHCCWINGQPCPHFDASPELVYRCSLRTELGDWAKVHRDKRYKRDVAVHWRVLGVPDCGDWTPDNPCLSCGWDGNEGDADADADAVDAGAG